MKTIFTFVFAVALLSCTSSGPDVAQGECLAPVDGMQIYKVTRTQGKSIFAMPVGGADNEENKSEMKVPETMHYVGVDCP